MFLFLRQDSQLQSPPFAVVFSYANASISKTYFDGWSLYFAVHYHSPSVPFFSLIAGTYLNVTRSGVLAFNWQANTCIFNACQPLTGGGHFLLSHLQVTTHKYYSHNFYPVMADNVPSKESLSKVLDLPLYDGEGKKVKFGDVITGSDKTIVVFIRMCLNLCIRTYIHPIFTPCLGHFFCGVSDLSSN